MPLQGGQFTTGFHFLLKYFCYFYDFSDTQLRYYLSAKFHSSHFCICQKIRSARQSGFQFIDLTFFCMRIAIRYTKHEFMEFQFH